MWEVAQTFLFHENFQLIRCDVSEGHFPFGGCTVSHCVKGVGDAVVVDSVVAVVTGVVVVAVCGVVVVVVRRTVSLCCLVITSCVYFGFECRCLSLFPRCHHVGGRWRGVRVDTVALVRHGVHVLYCGGCP